MMPVPAIRASWRSPKPWRAVIALAASGDTETWSGSFMARLQVFGAEGWRGLHPRSDPPLESGGAAPWRCAGAILSPGPQSRLGRGGPQPSPQRRRHDKPHHRRVRPRHRPKVERRPMRFELRVEAEEVLLDDLVAVALHRAHRRDVPED